MKEIIKVLKENCDLSKSKYSNYKVISIFEFDDELILGANIENASYSLSCCGERVALYNSIIKRKDFSKLKNIYVYSPSGSFPFPCGACLQVLSEFVNLDTNINIINKDEEVIVKKLKEIFPLPFNMGEENV